MSCMQIDIGQKSNRCDEFVVLEHYRNLIDRSTHVVTRNPKTGETLEYIRYYGDVKTKGVII